MASKSPSPESDAATSAYSGRSSSKVTFLSGVELGFELVGQRGGFDDLVEVAVGVSDDQLTGVVFGVGAGCDARGEELVVRKEQDTLPLARQAPGGLDGQQGLPASCPAIDDEAW